MNFRLFYSQQKIILENKHLNLDLLNVSHKEELFREHKDIFQIKSLVLFNDVSAIIKKGKTENEMILTIELPRRSYYLQFLPFIFLLMLLLFIYINDETERNPNSIYIIAMTPILIFVMFFSYQREFNRKRHQFIADIIGEK